MTSPDELMRAVEQFRVTLDDVGPRGLTKIADLAHLKILVTNYPVHARSFLDGLCESEAGR
jgi:hypothetical protein